MADPARLMADISDYQSSFDARAYRRAGHRIIMIKAAEGLSAAGALLHSRRCREAHDEGLIVVHYHYLHGHDGEGRFLAERVSGVWKSDDALCADVEIASVSAGAVQQWEGQLRARAFPRIFGYSGRSFLTERQAMARTLLKGWVIADYGTLKAPNIGDRLACGGTPCLGRQFTDGLYGSGPHGMSGIGRCDITWLTRKGMRLLLPERAPKTHIRPGARKIRPPKVLRCG